MRHKKMELAGMRRGPDHRPCVVHSQFHPHRPPPPPQVRRQAVEQRRGSLGSHPPAVLILPGFLSGSATYQAMAGHLRRLGYTAEVVPVSVRHWYGVLWGGDFAFYLQRLDAALQALHIRTGGPVALVGHSAGGWLARILLGHVPYQGVQYGRSELVHSLLTLGSPHQSTEQYPLSRVPEKLHTGPEVPPQVRGSSLKFANYYYPRGDAFPGVRMTCLVGNAITGRDAWGRGAQDSGETSTQGGLMQWLAKGPVDWEAYLAYESYLSGCGRGNVAGDGVTPVQIAHLPGAHNVVLQGVWHTPRRRGSGQVWYGDREAVLRWERYL